MKVCVIGGAGYVGSALVPALLEAGHEVMVWDVGYFGVGRNLPFQFDAVLDHDVRALWFQQNFAKGMDAVIHLACLSNDPSSDLDPVRTQEINYDSFEPIVVAAKEAGVKRFIYASSSSVYGVQPDDIEVTEDVECKPLTLYSALKLKCEDVLLKHASTEFQTTALRSATVCGYAPRLRLDLLLNRFCAQAYFDGKVTVFGGEQTRPLVHIQDLVRCYVAMLTANVSGQAFNFGGGNSTALYAAEIAADVFGKAAIDVGETDGDPRSYRINSARLYAQCGIGTDRGLRDVARDLKKAFELGLVRDWTAPIYHNVEQMKLRGFGK